MPDSPRRLTPAALKFGRLLAAALWLVLSLWSPGSTSAQPPAAFEPGERLIFALRWGIIPAGEAVLEVLPFATIDGQSAYHFLLTARTNAFVDLFYKLRQRIDAYTDLGMSRSLLYREVYTINQRRRDAVLTFDWQRQEARYTDLGVARDPIGLISGSFDPLSIFYYSRLFPLRERLELQRPVTDGKKNVIGRAWVVRRETVTVPSGTYDTFLLEPELKEVGGVFEKSKDAKIQVWVTADHRKIPVRLRSKVVVGSFVGELLSDQ